MAKYVYYTGCLMTTPSMFRSYWYEFFSYNENISQYINSYDLGITVGGHSGYQVGAGIHGSSRTTLPYGPMYEFTGDTIYSTFNMGVVDEEMVDLADENYYVGPRDDFNSDGGYDETFHHNNASYTYALIMPSSMARGSVYNGAILTYYAGTGEIGAVANASNFRCNPTDFPQSSDTDEIAASKLLFYGYGILTSTQQLYGSMR